MIRRELEFCGGKSQKFWNIQLDGAGHVVTFGRLGTKGQTKFKKFATSDKARRSLESLVRQKLGKGYVETTPGFAPRTDRERLNAKFVALSRRGIIAMHNAGYTQSDGYDDFLDTYDSHPDRASVRGYCFYHEQDVDSAREGHGLCLAFGPANPNDEDKRGAEIGRWVREELLRVGLKVKWNGTFRQRLTLIDFAWDEPAPAKGVATMDSATVSRKKSATRQTTGKISPRKPSGPQKATTPSSTPQSMDKRSRAKPTKERPSKRATRPVGKKLKKR